MRMFTIPNQSSVPKAYTQFTDDGPEYGDNRMIPSGNRDRLVDCMEEFVKYTIVMKPHFALFNDRFSERIEREQKEQKEFSKALEQGMPTSGLHTVKTQRPDEAQLKKTVNGVELDKI
jgi:hypothetical protein